MARLPQASDLQRRLKPAASPNVRAQAPDFGPMARGAQEIARGVDSLGQGAARLGLAIAVDQKEKQGFEVEKRLLDFELNAERALMEAKRAMPVGGDGYAAGFQDAYGKMARDFVGKRNDENIPEAYRDKVGLQLKRLEARLVGKAQSDELAERDRYHIDALETSLGSARATVETDHTRRDEMLERGRTLIEQAVITPDAKHRLFEKYGSELDKATVVSRLMKARSAAELKAIQADLAPDTADARKAGADVGKLSAKYESGGRGVGFVSSGKDDPGGPSYGIHQLSSQYSMGAFLRSAEGAKYRDQFAGLTPGTREFNAVYRKVAKADGEGFAAAQRAFYTRTHYEPAKQHAAGLGYDVTDRGVAEALFSIGVQHSGARTIISRAAAGGLPQSPAEQIKALYEARAQYVANLDTLKPGIKSSVLSRYKREVRDAIGMSGSSVDEGKTLGPVYEGPYGHLSMDQRRALWNQAQAEWQRKVAGVQQQIKKQMAVADQGIPLPPERDIELTQTVAALEDEKTSLMMEQLHAKAQVAAQYRKAPPAVLADAAREAESYIRANGGTPQQKAAADGIKKLSETAAKAVKDDPMTWAQTSRISIPLTEADLSDEAFATSGGQQIPMSTVQLKQLNFGAPDIGAALAERMQQAKGVAKYYGQSEQAFTEKERTFLRDVLKKGGPNMPVILGNIAKAAAEAGIEPAQIMREFAGKDAPEVAIVGQIIANNGDPGLIDTAQKAMAWRTSQGTEFKATFAKADSEQYINEIRGILGTTPTQVDGVRELTDTLYEYEARRQGLTTFNGNLYTDVMHRVLGRRTENGTQFGGIGTQGGAWLDGKWSSKVLVPSEIRTDSFDAMVDAIRPEDLAEAGISAVGGMPVRRDGSPMTIAEVRSAKWVSIGPGRYVLELGTDADGDRLVAGDEGGQPAVIDVRPIMDRVRRRKPEIFYGYQEPRFGLIEPPRNSWADSARNRRASPSVIPNAK